MNDHRNEMQRDQHLDYPVELTADPNRTLTLTAPLGRNDARLLGLGAENAGMNLSEYLVWTARLVTYIRFQLD